MTTSRTRSTSMGTGRSRDLPRSPSTWWCRGGHELPAERPRAVTITPLGPVEVMRVNVNGLPANTEFDFFVIQVPKGPFGLSWYQGDIETDEDGEGRQKFIG